MTKVSRCGIRKCFLSHGNARTSWHLNFSRVESSVEKCFLNDAGREQVSSRAAGSYFRGRIESFIREIRITPYKFWSCKHWQTVNGIDTRHTVSESVVITIIIMQARTGVIVRAECGKSKLPRRECSGIVSGSREFSPPDEAFIKSGALFQSDGERYGKNRGFAVKVSRYLFAPNCDRASRLRRTHICIRTHVRRRSGAERSRPGRHRAS